MTTKKPPPPARIASPAEAATIAAIADLDGELERVRANLADRWESLYAAITAVAGEDGGMLLLTELSPGWMKIGRYVQRRGAGLDERALREQLMRLGPAKRDRYLTRHDEPWFSVNLEAVQADAKRDPVLRRYLTAATNEGVPTPVKIPLAEASDEELARAREGTD